MMYLIALFVFALVPFTTAQSAQADIENYYSHELMKNACSKIELKRLHNEVISIAGTKAPEQAWILVKEMLCGNSKKSLEYVRVHGSNSIVHEDNTETEDGQSAITVKASNKLTPIDGAAWDVNVSDINHNNEISINYDMGGVCTGGFNVRFYDKSWKIVSDGIYCD